MQLMTFKKYCTLKNIDSQCLLIFTAISEAGCRTMFSPKYLITMIILTLPTTSHSEDMHDKRIAALKEIRLFAESTCVPVGNRTDVEVKGDLNAGLSSLLKKFVDLDVSTSGSFKKSEYLGVLQDRIEGVSNDPAGCKMKVMTEWKSEFLPTDGQ